MAYPKITQVARSTPFDPTGSSLASTNVNDALIEVLNTAGRSRYALVYGYNGNSTPLRYLELFQNVASNVSPYIIPDTSTINYLSVSVQLNVVSSLFTVYKNGSAVTTITITNDKTAYYTLPTPINLVAGDAISVSHTSGDQCKNIIFTTHFRGEV